MTGREKLVPPFSATVVMMLAHRILVITGAGISAESGIPTFRGKDGYWRNLDPAKLATPEAFRRDPHLVWEWYRERRATIRAAKPNDGHKAITRLAHHSREFLLVTQNVDDLHVRAQDNEHHITADRIVQIHGDIFLTRCSRCDYGFNEPEANTNGVPLCQKCGAMMRPGVVWFGEALDPGQIASAEDYIDNGRIDVVLVIGTTAMFGYIVDWALRAAAPGGRLIEINPDTTPLTRYATESLRKPAGVVLPQLVDNLLSR